MTFVSAAGRRTVDVIDVALAGGTTASGDPMSRTVIRWLRSVGSRSAAPARSLGYARDGRPPSGPYGWVGAHLRPLGAALDWSAPREWWRC